MERGRTYKIICANYPEIETYGTFEWAGDVWHDTEEFKEFLRVCVKPKLVERLKKEYSDILNSEDCAPYNTEEAMYAYIRDYLLEIFECLGIGAGTMFFSNIECDNPMLQLYEGFLRENDYVIASFSDKYFTFEEMPAPAFKNATAADT